MKRIAVLLAFIMLLSACGGVAASSESISTSDPSVSSNDSAPPNFSEIGMEFASGKTPDAESAYSSSVQDYVSFMDGMLTAGDLNPTISVYDSGSFIEISFCPDNAALTVYKAMDGDADSQRIWSDYTGAIFNLAQTGKDFTSLYDLSDSTVLYVILNDYNKSLALCIISDGIMLYNAVGDDALSALGSACSYSEYLQIEEGMSYSDVVDIIGSDGSLMVDSDDPDAYIVYTWPGLGEGNAEVAITFRHDLVTSKTQRGLN